MLSTIRTVLTEVEEEAPAPAKKRGGLFPRKGSKAFAPLAEADPETETPARRTKAARLGTRLAPLVTALAGRARLIRRKHLLFAVVLCLMILKPHWFVLGAVGVAALIMAAFLLIGAERIWRGVMLALHELSETDPGRAVRIRLRLDAFAMRWDAVLDRFPDGTVDGLYMPDFQVLSQEEARAEARLNERLQRISEQC